MDRDLIPPTDRDPSIPTRRDLLKLGASAAIGLGISGRGSVASKPASVSSGCILILMVGGPSQLETWDLKPEVSTEFRSPFRPIATSVPGVQVSEIFPRTARVMDRVALVRSLCHQAIPVHEAGQQLIQTGRFSMRGIEHPHFGSVLAKLLGVSDDFPPHVILGGRLGPMGGNMANGQGAGFLGEAFEPLVFDARTGCRSVLIRDLRPFDAFRIADEPDSTRDFYGRTRFGIHCLLARRLIEAGVRFVTINTSRSVFHESSWDCHGAAPFSSFETYRTKVGPEFDSGYSALILDLERRGLLSSTMVLALGEFGRTPRINPNGGRDHHPGCSSALFAGGPIRGGQVVGSSDSIGDQPSDRPVSPEEIAATIYQGFGLNLDSELIGPGDCPIRLVDPATDPILEIF